MNRWKVGLIMLIGLLAACSPTSALRTVTKGEEIVNYNFSEPGSFEEGAYDGAVLRVIDGVYRIDVTDGNNAMWWGQWGDAYDNVVIDVDVTQISERPETAFGVMCRVRGSTGQDRTPDPELVAIMEATTPPDDAPDSEATPEAETTAEAEATPESDVTPEAEATQAADATPEADATAEAEATAESEPVYGEGDGYLFLIQGTGSYAIMRARGRDIQPLVNWTLSDAIETGPNSTNHLRVACVGNYLSLTINDQFIADTTDDVYTRGQVGLAASAATRLGARIEFDNLQVSQAVVN